MRRRAVLVVLLAAGIAPAARAQRSTAELLTQAHEFYERVEIERALHLLRQVVAPDWPFDVTPEQRVDAYKYLGASLALVGRRDSALLAFRAAVERDPFTDLDPNLFTPAQLAVFSEARRRVFALGVRPVAAVRVDPRTERLSLTVAVTHAAGLAVALRPVGAGVPGVALFQGTAEGTREIRWDGLLGDGRLAPPGRYAVVAVGRSSLLGTTDSARVYFDLRHEVAPLEDTLPDLAPGDLLPEVRSPRAATGSLVKGMAVAGAALLLSHVATNDRLRSGLPGGADVIAGAGVATGLVTFLAHRHRAPIPANAAENARRGAARAAANDAIRSRNAAKIAATVLVVSPVAGEGP